MERKITFRFGHSRTLKNHISFLIWRHLVFAIIKSKEEDSTESSSLLFMCPWLLRKHYAHTGEVVALHGVDTDLFVERYGLVMVVKIVSRGSVIEFGT